MAKAITTLKQAQNALEKVRVLKDEIEQLRKSSGIEAKETQMDELKKAAVGWAVETDTETIPLDGGHAQLRRDKYGGTWVATKGDLDGAPPGIIPIFSVLKGKFKNKTRRKEVWLAITKRVIDPEKMTAAVEEDVLTVEDVENSFYEKEKAAYLRIYTESEVKFMAQKKHRRRKYRPPLNVRDLAYMKPSNYVNHLTLGEVAREIGCDPSWIRKLERADRIPKAVRVQRGAISVRLWSPAQVEEISEIIRVTSRDDRASGDGW